MTAALCLALLFICPCQEWAFVGVSIQHLLQIGVLPTQLRHFALELSHTFLFLQFFVQLRPVVYCSVDGVVSGVAAWCEVLLLAVSGELKLTLLNVQLLDYHRDGGGRVPRQLKHGLRLGESIAAVSLKDRVQAGTGVD